MQLLRGMRGEGADLLASCSEAAPLALHMLSTSSMKIVAGAYDRAMSNSSRTMRSASPLYLLASVEEETLKNVVALNFTMEKC